MAEFIFKKMVRDAGFTLWGESGVAGKGAEMEKAGADLRARDGIFAGDGKGGEEKVMAEGKDRLGIGVRDVFRVDSAAVSYEEIGNDIYPPAKRTLSAHGIPFGRHSAHRVSDAEASGYDVIVIMDSSNRRLLSRIISTENMSKVHSMMEYAGRDSDVSDPWYTGDFERTYRDISEGCAGLLEELVKTE